MQCSLPVSQHAYYWRLEFYLWNTMQSYDGVIQFWSTEVCNHVLSLDLFHPPLGNLQTLLICEYQIPKLCCKKVMKLKIQPDLWWIVCSLHFYVIFIAEVVMIFVSIRFYSIILLENTDSKRVNVYFQSSKQQRSHGSNSAIARGTCQHSLVWSCIQ